MALSIDILHSPGWFAFTARTFTWVEAISRIPDRQAKKSRIPYPNFGESRFPGSSQIPNPVKIFCVLPNPAPYFGQIPDPENTLPDLVRQAEVPVSISLWVFSVPRKFLWNTTQPYRQPMPKRARCKGQMFISWIFAGVWKQALSAKISSTSVSQPLNFSNFLWLSILLLHETRSTISHDRFLDLASGPHSPPTKSAKVQGLSLK